jgi:hypothetical protein
VVDIQRVQLNGWVYHPVKYFAIALAVLAAAALAWAFAWAWPVGY